ncbi:MAG: serine hydrolase [Lachnospiraceae bacterium]|nr:serine hydrolase [Lachnospiraceae bacterium]
MKNRKNDPENMVRNPIRKRITRTVSLGLCAAMLFAQTARADVYITPFGTLSESGQSAGQTVSEPGASEPGGMEPGASEPGVLEPGTSGPGAAEPGKTPVPSASYSTKESVETGASKEPGTSESAEQVNIDKPQVQAESAVLYDVTHGKFLFEKNADEKLYPASITKLMTALLVLEHADLNDTVTFSEAAVTNLESGAVTLNLTAGDRVSVKDCLYGLLLKSANEVANGLAEYVGGSVSGFADMMNAKAAALGCADTHFVNPNGLNNQNHYTTCRDMAKIAEAAFANQTLCGIASTLSYTFPATKKVSARTITPGHKMLYPTDSRYYEGIIGGKTGYTSLAGNTLVTCTERDGVRMIAVVLKAKSTHYTDTKAMLDYGYELVKTDGTAGGQVQNGGNPENSRNHWIADGDFWRFELANGTRLSDCFVQIDGVEYLFDADGKMATGWQQLSGSWHYFDGSGAMVKNDWRQDQGHWFYLGSDGAMATDTWIDRKYYVGADGIWIP